MKLQILFLLAASWGLQTAFAESTSESEKQMAFQKKIFSTCQGMMKTCSKNARTPEMREECRRFLVVAGEPEPHKDLWVLNRCADYIGKLLSEIVAESEKYAVQGESAKKQSSPEPQQISELKNCYRTKFFLCRKRQDSECTEFSEKLSKIETEAKKANGAPSVDYQLLLARCNSQMNQVDSQARMAGYPDAESAVTALEGGQ